MKGRISLQYHCWSEQFIEQEELDVSHRNKSITAGRVGEATTQTRSPAQLQ
jgi:hypothetical protein